MDPVVCTCGTLIGCYRDIVSLYCTNNLQLFAKENGIHPEKLKFFMSQVEMGEICDYLNLPDECCRTHLLNYYDPTKALLS